MSIASEITRIKTNIENAYNKCAEKGATMPEVKNSENLAACIDTVSSGGSNVFASYQIVDGVAMKQTGDIAGMFNNIESVAEGTFYYTFYSRKELTGKISFPKLTTVEKQGFYYTFSDCDGITSVDLSSLIDVGANGLQYMFNYCDGITSVNLNSLTTVASKGLLGTFSYCKALTSISFPSLISVQSDSFNNLFSSCNNLTEIHFRADMQSTIESMSNYSSKWGASKATIYFDL